MRLELETKDEVQEMERIKEKATNFRASRRYKPSFPLNCEIYKLSLSSSHTHGVGKVYQSYWKEEIHDVIDVHHLVGMIIVLVIEV